jgi:alpha-acetolactate decarboxylase
MTCSRPVTLRTAAFLVSLFIITSVSAADAPPEPFGIRAYGNFKRVVETGDASGVIKLGTVAAAKGMYGVGALAGMRGEILLWDGKLLVSRGDSHKGKTEAPAATDEAALFIQGLVKAWVEVRVPSAMTQPEFEAFVVESATEQGIDSSKAFPFAVRSDKLTLTWHVVSGTARSAGHGIAAHKQGHAQSRVFRESGASGVLLGFYTGAALEGIASHPGERFHVHFADPGFSVSGHVDEYRVPDAAILLLPRT